MLPHRSQRPSKPTQSYDPIPLQPRKRASTTTSIAPSISKKSCSNNLPSFTQTRVAAEALQQLFHSAQREAEAVEDQLDSKARVFCDIRDADFNKTHLDIKFISYYTLVEWATELVSEQLVTQRQFETMKLIGVVSYHGCRTMNEVPVILRSDRTFKQMMTVLKTMKKNKRQIITALFEQELKEQEV